MEEAMRFPAREQAVDEFAIHLLQMLGCDRHNRAITVQQDIMLQIRRTTHTSAIALA